MGKFTTKGVSDFYKGGPDLSKSSLFTKCFPTQGGGERGFMEVGMVSHIIQVLGLDVFLEFYKSLNLES